MLLIGIIAVILVVASVCFMNRGGDVRNVERIIGERSLYTQKDIETAMDIAVRAFSEGYEDCKLLRIAYDEAETLAEIDRQRDRHGELRILVLVSDFYVGNNAEACFNLNETYHDWKWIFRDHGEGWELYTWGYA